MKVLLIVQMSLNWKAATGASNHFSLGSISCHKLWWLLKYGHSLSKVTFYFSSPLWALSYSVNSVAQSLSPAPFALLPWLTIGAHARVIVNSKSWFTNPLRGPRHLLQPPFFPLPSTGHLGGQPNWAMLRLDHWCLAVPSPQSPLPVYWQTLLFIFHNPVLGIISSIKPSQIFTHLDNW